MEQARPDSTLLPAAQMDAEHHHDDRDARDARITRVLTAPDAIPAHVDPACREAERVNTAAATEALAIAVSPALRAAIVEHRDAYTALQFEPDDSDPVTDRLCAIVDKAIAGVSATPCNSLTDLKAKIAYILPRVLPDQVDDDHREFLQAIRTDLERLCPEPLYPAGSHADADLLRLGEQFDQAHARWRLTIPAWRDAQDRVGRAIDAAKIPGRPSSEEITAAWALPGAKEADQLFDDASNAIDPICEAIWKLPHTTPAGLAVKARATIPHTFFMGNYETDAALGEREDLPERPTRLLIEACCTLAGVDWRGDPIAPPVPDPVYAVIDQHLAARAAADRVRHDDFDAAHSQRIEALRAVHGARPTTVVGLLALARHMRSYLTEDGEPPGQEKTAADQAFSCLVEACVGLHATRYPGMDRDWAEFVAYHPGFLPVPQHQPAGLMKLGLAIPLEAKRLLALAEVEFERRRQAYVEFHDPAVWPRVAAKLRREMRMDALALVAADLPDSDEESGPHPDPVHALIADHRAAYAEWDRTSAVWNNMIPDAPGRAEAIAASKGPGERESDAFDALFSARPTTLGGAAALAIYLVKAVAQVRIDADPTDGERALGVIATAMERLGYGRGTAPSEHPDAAILTMGPVVADMAARRDGLSAAASGSERAALDEVGPSPQAHTPECSAWFERLRAVEARNGHAEASAAYEVADSVLLDTLRGLAEVRATTLDGLVFKARLASAHEDPAISDSIVADLIAMGEQSVVGATSVRPKADAGHDLAACALPELARLYETWDGIFRHIIGAGAIPCFGDDGPSGYTSAGDILDREYDRASRFLDAIADEARDRRPETDDDRNERLNILVRNELEGGGQIADRSLLAELAAAWGA